MDDGWVEWGGELIWAVGFTDGGAPFGLHVSDFDPADLAAMGLPGASGSRIHGPGGWLPEPDAARGSDDAPAHVAPGTYGEPSGQVADRRDAAVGAGGR